MNGAQSSLHLAILGRTERTWVVRIYAHEIGAYLQRLRLDCAGAQAEMSFCWQHMPNKTRFFMTISWQFFMTIFMTIYNIWCYNGRVKRIDFFTSDECGLTNRAFQHFRLSDLSVRSTQTLFSLCSSFIYCQLHVTVICTMLQKQVSVFSIFIITVYQSLKSNLRSFQWKPSNRHLSVLSIRS